MRERPGGERSTRVSFPGRFGPCPRGILNAFTHPVRITGIGEDSIGRRPRTGPHAQLCAREHVELIQPRSLGYSIDKAACSTASALRSSIPAMG